jgi:hypothetical protein
LGDDAFDDLFICGGHDGTEQKVLHLSLCGLALNQFAYIVDGLNGLVHEGLRGD